jgi:hypothetical protein
MPSGALDLRAAHSKIRAKSKLSIKSLRSVLHREHRPEPGGERDSRRVSGFGFRVSGFGGVELYDPLGREVAIPGTTPQPPPSPLRSVGGGVRMLDVSGVPSGIYYLRLSSGGYVVTRRVAVEH